MVGDQLRAKCWPSCAIGSTYATAKSSTTTYRGSAPRQPTTTVGTTADGTTAAGTTLPATA
eukprot:4886926-Prorocentrum_lima.AAC.1